MKEQFETMTLDQLRACRDLMCYLYPAADAFPTVTAEQTWYDLDEVLTRKQAEYYESDECKQKRAEVDALYASLFQPQDW